MLLFTVATGVLPILKEQTFIHLFILCCSWTWGQGWGEKMWIKENLIKTGRCGCHHHLKLGKIGNKFVCIGYKGICFFLLLVSPFAADLATQYRGSSRVLVWFKIWFQRLFFIWLQFWFEVFRFFPSPVCKNTASLRTVHCWEKCGVVVS